MQQQQQPAAPAPAPRAAKPKPVPPPEFQSASIDRMSAADLGKLLSDPASTEFQKAKACQRLAVVGTAAEVPALASLLTDPKLSHYARTGLETIPGPAPDDALRAALPKVKGGVLVGVINSIGYRRDEKAVPALARMLASPDPATAQAAAVALGKISGTAAAKELVAALPKAKDRTKVLVADAGLVCAEGLLASGRREEAMALYTKLTAADVPKPQRLAAMHGIIQAETSLNRPR